MAQLDDALRVHLALRIHQPPNRLTRLASDLDHAEQIQ